MLRGGGGRGAAKATARKRAESKETELLEGLKALLQNFSAPSQGPSKNLPRSSATAKPNAKGKGGTKPPPKNPPELPKHSAEDSEQGLVQALERLIGRAKQEPGTLITRLTELVQSATKGHNLQQVRKPRRERKAAARADSTEQTAVDQPAKKQKADPAPQQKEPSKRTWAEVASTQAKQHPPGRSQKKPDRPDYQKLLPQAWPTGALVAAKEVLASLETGKAPTGKACFCSTLQQAQDLQRLAKVHQHSALPFALLLPHMQSRPDGSKVMYFPTQAKGGAPSLHPFCVLPIGTEWPTLPEQKLKSTKVSSEQTPLVTFRITIAKHLMARAVWEGLKANPTAHVTKIFGDKVHSDYGWREKEITTKRQQTPDVLLQGFLRTKDNVANAVLQESGKDYMFIDRLTSQAGQSPRPNIWWIKTHEDEDHKAYYKRALAEAQKENASLAFRKGGGSFLGIRLPAAKRKPQLHAWSLHGAPKHWGVNEVLQCLLDATCTEVAILRPPGRQRHWLVKAIVPEENEIGMVGIQAGERVLYLNRIQNKVKRSEEVLQVIRPQRKTQTKDSLQPKETKKPPEQTEASQGQNGAGKETRDRSRSPAKDRKAEPPIVTELSGRYTALECGGDGSCGYQCLAAALAFDKGYSFQDIQDNLIARGRTIRHDIYKHLQKHSSEYEEFFVPDPDVPEEIEDGPAPLSWSDYIEATLRQKRWVDGIQWKAAARRFGLFIIVVPLDASEKDDAMSFGEPKSGREPVVLLLKKGHYQLAQRREGKQWPKQWITAPAGKLDSALFRGGGKSCASSVHSWRLPNTPSTVKKSNASKASWRCSATPTAGRQSQAASQKKVSKVAKPIAAQSCRRTKTAASTKHSWRTDKTPTAREPSSQVARPSVESVAEQSSQGGFAQSIVTGRSETFVWQCNLCQHTLRYSNKRSLSCARRRHIAKAHPGKHKAVHLCFPKYNESLEPIAEASALIPEDQRVWSCPKCGKGLPSMPHFLLKKARDKHVMACYGYSKTKLRKLHYQSPIWKQHREQLNKQLQERANSRTDSILQEYNAKTQAGAARIPQKFTADGTWHFTCGRCTLVFDGCAKLTSHDCPGHEGRAKVLRRKTRAWLRYRKMNNQDAVAFFIRTWKLTRAELSVLEQGVAASDVPQLHAWIPDLCEHGDIEPNPGPSTSLRACLTNTNGKENTWALARWVIAEKVPLCVATEHSMTESHQADLATFLKRHGYRSWFIAPRAIQNANGHWYTSGGVAVFVRKDKMCRQIEQCITADGQALMMQLDHVFVIATYLPPRSESETAEILSTLDDWIRSFGPSQPVIVLGDFNHEPELATRWTHLSEGGACGTVKEHTGKDLPTRWNGNRCIDWVWASRPYMLSHFRFADLSLSDHRIINFRLQYDQPSLYSCQEVPTRKLLCPEQVDKKVWAEALSSAWAHVTVPAVSTTEQEWIDFCQKAEWAHDTALRACGQISRSGAQQAARPKGSELQIRLVTAKVFRLKQNGSFRELKLRKLLGRTREAILQSSKEALVPEIVLKRIWGHPLVRDQGFQTLEEICSWAEHELKVQVRADNLSRLQQWRQNMRSSMSKARAWVKKQNTLPVASVFDDSYQNGGASKSDHEALKAIEAFWTRIWDRDRPNPLQAFQAWQEHAPAGQNLAWHHITANELFAAAARQKGCSKGPDGWLGDEVCSWPLQTWQILEELFGRWVERGEVPNVWSSTRQVHLQKPDATMRVKDRAINAKDMRPISVQCIIWRIFASAWTHRESTRSWVKSWAHPTACGGLPGTGVAQAIDALRQEFDKPAPETGILVSLDFQKCFDTIDPKLGILCLQHLGCPQAMLALLQVVWNQRRWLTHNQEYLPTPSQVSHSLPQGDAVSPLTLLAIMTGLTAKVVAQSSQPHTLVTYLDDRNFIARSAAQAAELWNLWKDSSAQLGLWESDSKLKVVCRKGAFKPQLLQHGFEPKHIASTARVLGIDFASRLDAVDRPSQKQRLHGAKERLVRAGQLPVSSKVKAQLVASVAVPKAVWGSWTSLQPMKQLSPSVRKVTGGQHACASVELFFLLAGHGLHTEFSAGCQAYYFLAQAVRQRPRPWPRTSLRGSWLGTVRKWMNALGWQERGPWTWRHDILQFDISWAAQLNEQQKQREQHHLRESWRRAMFEQFLSSARNDAIAVSGVTYQEQRMTLVRKIFAEQDTHAKGVMIGGVVSDARFQRMKNEAVQPCVWCHTAEAPTWLHLAWHCDGISSSRPVIPTDALQKTLGWPSGRLDYDRAVLTHLAAVRSKLLDRRYRNI
eukprot:Skav204708  [mRNA]  locus=scaffold3332:74506:81342:+ [translate_table: standard]